MTAYHPTGSPQRRDPLLLADKEVGRGKWVTGLRIRRVA